MTTDRSRRPPGAPWAASGCVQRPRRGRSPRVPAHPDRSRRTSCTSPPGSRTPRTRSSVQSGDHLAHSRHAYGVTGRNPLERTRPRRRAVIRVGGRRFPIAPRGSSALRTLTGTPGAGPFTIASLGGEGVGSVARECGAGCLRVSPNSLSRDSARKRFSWAQVESGAHQGWFRPWSGCCEFALAEVVEGSFADLAGNGESGHGRVASLAGGLVEGEGRAWLVGARARRLRPAPSEGAVSRPWPACRGGGSRLIRRRPGRGRPAGCRRAHHHEPPLVDRGPDRPSAHDRALMTSRSRLNASAYHHRLRETSAASTDGPRAGPASSSSPRGVGIGSASSTVGFTASRACSREGSGR